MVRQLLAIELPLFLKKSYAFWTNNNDGKSLQIINKQEVRIESILTSWLKKGGAFIELPPPGGGNSMGALERYFYATVAAIEIYGRYISNSVI